MRSFVVVIVASAVLLATAAATSGAPQSGYADFIGTWSCHSKLGNDIQYTAELMPDGGWLSLRSAWRDNGYVGFFQNYIRQQTAVNQWVAISYGSDGWTFQGKSDGWQGNVLTFTGYQQTQAGDRMTRETFTLLSDDRFQHDWQMAANDVWQTTSSTICRRAS